MYLEMGKFGVPAKHHEAIALIYSKVRHARTIDKHEYEYGCEESY